MKEFKSVIDAFPEAKTYWDYSLNKVNPEKVAHRSNKEFFWKCLNGHPSYLCSPDKRIYRKYGCPICSNYKVVPGINDFKSQYPELMLDWDYDTNGDIKPEELSQRSITVVSWKCHECGHTWQGRVRDATEKEVNCPICSRKNTANKRHLLMLSKNGCLDDEQLLLDWDYSKNEKGPNEYTKQTNTYAYWKCHICGYEWRAKINNRSNGRGCPCCGNRVLVKGVNDLLTKNPRLAKEWHPTKNGNLKPSDVYSQSNIKVWWLCPNGHEYQATVCHRSSINGTNCPLCNKGRQTSFREQALYFYIKKMYPSAINGYRPDNFEKFELDIYIPEFKWAIEYDGEAWHKETKFDRERRKYHLCKERGITLFRVKERMPNELGLDLADYMLSSDDFDSTDGFTQVIHMVLERLDLSGFYRINPIDVNLDRDRFEIMEYATSIKQSFEDKNPEIAKEWHPTKNHNLKPNMFKPKSDFKGWWLCPKCGNEYEMTFNHRTLGMGCPICARKKQVKTNRLNRLKKYGPIINPLLIKEWNYEKNINISPSELTSGSKEKVWWKCSKCDYEWQATVANRSYGKGCPRCAGFKLYPGYNDLATVHPELLKEWDYEKNKEIDPNNIHHGSTKSVWWKCSVCGYEYKAPIARRDKGSGCRKCADKLNSKARNKMLLSKNGSLGEICPYLIKEYSLENTKSIFEISSTSNEKVKWECSICGHKWETTPYLRKIGHGCPICGQKKSLANRKHK